MKPKTLAMLLLVAATLWLGTVGRPLVASADATTPLSGFGTPTVDGILGDLEWSEADSYDFRVNIPNADGGGTSTGTISVMNDATNLYIAVRILFPFRSTGVFIHFDTNRNGEYSDVGEDYIGVSPNGLRPFIDGVYTSAPPCPVDSRCGVFDAALGGTSDGDWGARHDSAAQVFEMSHPLDSSDDIHDVSLQAGDTVPLYAFLRLWSLSLPCNEAPECYADTYMSGPNYFGLDVLILPPPIPPAPTHLAQLVHGYNLIAGPMSEALAPAEFMACLAPDSWSAIYLWDAEIQRWQHFTNPVLHPNYLNRPEVGGIQALPILSSVVVLTGRAVPDATLKDGPGPC